MTTLTRSLRQTSNLENFPEFQGEFVKTLDSKSSYFVSKHLTQSQAIRVKCCLTWVNCSLRSLTPSLPIRSCFMDLTIDCEGTVL